MLKIGWYGTGITRSIESFVIVCFIKVVDYVVWYAVVVYWVMLAVEQWNGDTHHHKSSQDRLKICYNCCINMPTFGSEFPIGIVSTMLCHCVTNHKT